MAEGSRKYLIPFILVTSLFFLWAFVHNLEPILIPHLKKACQLDFLQATFIDSAVYFAYFLMALPAGFAIKKYGYKVGIILGLLIYAIGAILFYPAADSRQYIFFLGALFIIATGCAFLETAANPYVTLLGDPASAATRLNFAQSFNGFGAFIAPMLGGNLILSGIEYSEADLGALTSDQLNQYLQTEADAVKIPYLVIAGVVLLVALMIFFTRMPEAERTGAQPQTGISKAWSHRHLKWGVIAQFFYVGAQVCVTSLFIPFAKFTNDMPEKTAASWLGIALVGFMIGRFAGTYLTRFVVPHKLLAIFALVCVLLLILAVFVKSGVAMWAVFSVPFFESIMFPTIFALAIKDLKEDTEIGSSLVVMAVVGGALFPLAMGWLSIQFNLQIGYIVPLLCFMVVAWYGLRGYRIAKT